MGGRVGEWVGGTRGDRAGVDRACGEGGGADCRIKSPGEQSEEQV